MPRLPGRLPTRIPDPAAAGLVQMSDANGNLSWQPITAADTGIMEPVAVVAFSASPYTAAPGQFVPVDTTSGAVTVTLPAAPEDATVIGIKMVIQGSTNAVTFNCSGSDVFNKAGGSTSGTLTLASQGVILQYFAASAIWYVFADDLPLAQLDTRYTTPAAATATAALAAQSGPASAGYVAWTGDRWTSPRYAATFASAYPAGDIALTRLNIPFAVTCTGNVDVMWTAGTGTAGSNGYLGIFDSTGAQIAVSADISGHATGWITLATGKTSWAAGFYYCAFVIGTQFGTTGCGPDALGGALATLATAAPGDAQPYRASLKGGSLTAMPSSLTLGSGWTAWFMNMEFLLR